VSRCFDTKTVKKYFFFKFEVLRKLPVVHGEPVSKTGVVLEQPPTDTTLPHCYRNSKGLAAIFGKTHRSEDSHENPAKLHRKEEKPRRCTEKHGVFCYISGFPP
jgi:hypothetical protein